MDNLLGTKREEKSMRNLFWIVILLLLLMGCGKEEFEPSRSVQEEWIDIDSNKEYLAEYDCKFMIIGYGEYSVICEGDEVCSGVVDQNMMYVTEYVVSQNEKYKVFTSLTVRRFERE